MFNMNDRYTSKMSNHSFCAELLCDKQAENPTHKSRISAWRSHGARNDRAPSVPEYSLPLRPQTSRRLQAASVQEFGIVEAEGHPQDPLKVFNRLHFRI